jgi:hypothetical protein
VGGENCYDHAAKFHIQEEAGRNAARTGVADNSGVPVSEFTTSTRSAAEKCDLKFLTTCGSKRKIKEANQRAIVTRRRRLEHQRRLEVRAERRRQLKEDPARKLTVRELEADLWYERGIQYLVPAVTKKLNAQLQSYADNHAAWGSFEAQQRN